MRVDDALLAYERRSLRPIAVRPADPRALRANVSSLKSLQLCPEAQKVYFDAIQQLNAALEKTNSLDLSTAPIWKPAAEYYKGEPNPRGERATCFDALNLLAWRLYFSIHGLEVTVDSDDPIVRELSALGPMYGEAVVAMAEEIALSKKCDEDCIIHLSSLWELLDLPPEVLPIDVTKKIASAIEACGEREQDFYSMFYPIVGFSSTLWRLFSPLTIDRTLAEMSTMSFQDIVNASRALQRQTNPIGEEYDVVLAQCANLLFERITRPPYAGHRFLVKSLLHFLYPVAAATRYKSDRDYVTQKLEILDKHLSAVAWCDEPFIRRLQVVMDETWGFSTVDIGLVQHFCVDLSANVTSYSTSELREALVAEFGLDAEYLLSRFVRSELHGFFEGVAKELDLNYGSYVGWQHWAETGHIVSIARRGIPQEEVSASHQGANVTAGKPPSIQPSSAAATKPETRAANVSGVVNSGSMRKKKPPLLGPFVEGQYDKDKFEIGYSQFRQLIREGKGRTEEGEVFKNWKVVDDFVSKVANRALSLSADASDDTEVYKVNVAKLRAQYPGGGRQNLATQIEGRFDYMIGRLIGRRIILATADESSKATDLARSLGYASSVDNGYKGMAAYLTKCGLVDSDYQKPPSSKTKEIVEGEFEWLKQYRKP